MPAANPRLYFQTLLQHKVLRADNINTDTKSRKKVTHPRLFMNFALRNVRCNPGVNSRAEFVTLAPGLHPERRLAPLARGISLIVFNLCILKLIIIMYMSVNICLNRHK